MDFLLSLGRGLLGVAVFLGIALALSERRSAVQWKMVAGGLGLQLIIGILVLNVAWVAGAFEVLGGWFVTLLGYTQKGTEFLFGALATADAIGPVIAFQVLPSIIFFSALTSLAYHFGILQRVVAVFAWVMRRAMKLTGAETLATAANVFVGQTEAPLVVKPYLAKMSRSELMALMVGGMATIAGAVMAIYIKILGGADEESQKQFAKLLLCASLMNAPAALVIAKILCPPGDDTKLGGQVEISDQQKGNGNALEAVARGTTDGLRLAVNVGAMVLVFLALIAMVNGVLGWVGGLGEGTLNGAVSSASGSRYDQLSLEAACGLICSPLAWLAGANGGDIMAMGELLGVKAIANEFIAFQSLGAMQDAGTMSPRGTFLATFALCGFANFSSIGIQIGGIGALAPERRSEIATLGVKAMIGGTLASLLSATVVSVVG